MLFSRLKLNSQEKMERRPPGVLLFVPLYGYFRDISARFHVGTIGKHISASTGDYNRLHNLIMKVAENYRSYFMFSRSSTVTKNS